MNRTSILVTVLLFSIVNLNAQKYCRFLEEKQFRNGKNVCYKGEIFPISNSSGSKVDVIHGKDTITGVKVNLGLIQIFDSTFTDITSQKLNYVKIKGEDEIYVNVSSLGFHNDTIWFVPKIGKRDWLADGNSYILSLKRADVGDSFRLFIPNVPSIFYSVSELLKYEDPQTDTEDFGSGEETAKGIAINSSVVIYILIGIAVVVVLAILYLLYRKGFILYRKEPIIETFNSSSLEKVIVKYDIPQKKFLKWNKNIPSNYFKLEPREKNKINNDLQNTGLIVGYGKKIDVVSKSGARNREDSQLPYKNLTESSSTSDDSQINFDKSQKLPNTDILQHLLRIETNIIGKIDSLHSSRDLPGQIDKLKNEAERLKNEMSKLEETNRELVLEKDKVKKELISANEKAQKMTSALESYNGKVIFVDSLKAYCEAVTLYFNYCSVVSAQAYDYFNLINQHNQTQAFVLGQLLLKYENGVKALPVGNWAQIAQDIKDTGTTTNNLLISSFSQIQNEKEKLREFKRLLFTEVLIKFSSSILILAEAFRNLSGLKVSSKTVNVDDVENVFGKHVSELLSKLRSTGLEAKYVSLFKNYMEFLGQTKLVNEMLSPAYQNVQDLQKDSIAEVISFGFKNEFEETDTLIILA